MIRKQISLSIVAAMTAMSGLANVDGLPVGILDTDLPKVSPYGHDEAGEVKAAMLLDPVLPEGIKNPEIVSVRFGLTSKINISEVTVWATYQLDEPPFMEYTLGNDIVKGWNEADLPEGVAINNVPFYVGYTLKTEGASYPVAVVENGYGKGFVFNNGSGWNTYSFEDDGDLAVCVKIAGDGLPLFDLGILDVKSPRIMKSANKNKIEMEVLNAGSSKITGFKIVCKENNESAIAGEWSFPVEIESNRRCKVEFDHTPATGVGMNEIPFMFEINEITDGEDYQKENNNYTVYSPISPYSFNRRVLVEEYTSELCSNCPNAASLLHEAINDANYSDKVLVVCHHSGFSPDDFTQPCDNDLIELFGNGSASTYNPAMSFDRLPVTQGSVITHVPGSVKDLRSMFDACLERDVDVDLEVFGEWDNAEKKLNIDVNGMSFDGTIPDDVNAITVYLLEDDVAPAKRQLGADESFRHNHVIRAYNSSWGDPLEWDSEGKFSYNVKFDVPGSVNPRNLSLVAMVSKNNPENHLDCAIANAVSCANLNMGSFSSVQDTVSDMMPDAVTYYNIAGYTVSKDTKGIIIKVTHYNDGSITTEKVRNF